MVFVRVSVLCVPILLVLLAGCRIDYDSPGGGVDASGPDGPGLTTQGARSCSSNLDDTLALYDFESITGTIVDSAQAHDGTPVGTQLAHIAGASGCGSALYFGGTNGDSYVRIPDSPDWDLTVGSVDFWILPASCDAVVISRDAKGTDFPGHLQVALDAACSIRVRIQVQGNTYLTSTPLSQEVWHHVGLNFAPAEYQLWIDGALEIVEQSDGGITGNDNPWVLGADSNESDEGAALPLSGFARNVALDRVRISSTTRHFE